MSKTRLQTLMLGRLVKIALVDGQRFQPDGPQAKYAARNGQVGRIVNVYLDKGGAPIYDVLFPDGQVVTELYSFGMIVQGPDDVCPHCGWQYSCLPPANKPCRSLDHHAK
jgi:hypothetical protein